MNASARASDLIMVASRLVVLMEQEIAILHEMKVADIAELQPEKELLVRAYLEHGRALEEVPGQLATVAPAIKQELQQVLERFRATAGHNERALRAAHEVNARLVKAVVDAVNMKRGEAATYTSTGTLNSRGAGDSRGSMPLTVDQRL